MKRNKGAAMAAVAALALLLIAADLPSAATFDVASPVFHAMISAMVI